MTSKMSLSDSIMHSLEESWSGSAKTSLDALTDFPVARTALARFLEGVKDSVFMSLRASKITIEGASSAGDVEALDRDLAMEVDNIEKEVENLAKNVKDTRETVRVGENHFYAHPLPPPIPPPLTFLSFSFFGMACTCTTVSTNFSPGDSQAPQLTVEEPYRKYYYRRQ